MKLTFFGTAAGFPTKARPHTQSIGLWPDDSLYLFDAGDGVAGQFSHLNVPPNALRAIFLTHLHTDHLGGLPVLLQWLFLNKRRAPLPIYVPDRSLDGLREFLHLIYLYPMSDFELTLLPVRAGFAHEVDNLLVKPIPSHHLEAGEARRAKRGERAESQSFSYLIETDTKKIYLSGDIASPEEVARHAAGADLAIVELAHFTPEELGHTLSAANLGHLVITHLLDTLEPEEATIPDRLRAAGYDGNITIATDGLEVDL